MQIDDRPRARASAWCAALALTLALGTGVAQADNGRLYIGAGVSRNSLRDITATNSNLDSTDGKVWVGFRPISLFGIEADYIDLGSQTINLPQVPGCIDICPPKPPICIDRCPLNTHLQYKAFAGYAVGFVPVPVSWVDVFGKVGVARWTARGGTSLSPPGGFFSLSDKGTQFAWGAGGQLHGGNIGARLEYENLRIRSTNGANVVSLSVFLNLF